MTALFTAFIGCVLQAVVESRNNVLGYVCNPSSSKERDAASKDA